MKDENGKTIRLTGGQLFERIVQASRFNGDFQYIDPILDYVLPDDEERELTNYQFDFFPEVSFGGSEGIYIDCFLHGKFDESGRQWKQIGTIKTLRTDLEACKLMGALCGALLYHESSYVNSHLELFTPERELQRNASWKGRLALQRAIELKDKVDGCIQEVLEAAKKDGNSSVLLPFDMFSQILGWELEATDEASIELLKNALFHRSEVREVRIGENGFLLKMREKS